MAEPAKPAAEPVQPSLFATTPAAAAASPSIPAAVIDEIAAARKATAERDAALAQRDAVIEELKANFSKAQETIGLGDRANKELAAARKADAIRNAALNAAIKHGAVSEAQVVKLVLDELDQDEAGAVVHKADPKISVDAFVAKFLDDNKHLAKPRVAPGSGATGFTGRAPTVGDMPKIDLTTNDGLTTYARMRTYRTGQAPNPSPTAKPGA